MFILVMCLPLLLPNGTLTGVVELTRSGRAPPFKESDLQVVNGFLNWGGVVQHYAQMYQIMHKVSFLCCPIRSDYVRPLKSV